MPELLRFAGGVLGGAADPITLVACILLGIFIRRWHWAALAAAAVEIALMLAIVVPQLSSRHSAAYIVFSHVVSAILVTSIAFGITYVVRRRVRAPRPSAEHNTQRSEPPPLMQQPIASRVIEAGDVTATVTMYGKPETDSFLCGIAGESFKNSDGSSRQAYIARCRPGDPVTLRPEPGNEHDRNAVAVHHQVGQLGYLKRDFAREVGRKLAEGVHFEAVIEMIGPGTDGRYLGVVLRISGLR
jgi:hypothetical protein